MHFGGQRTLRSLRIPTRHVFKKRLSTLRPSAPLNTSFLLCTEKVRKVASGKDRPIQLLFQFENEILALPEQQHPGAIVYFVIRGPSQAGSQTHRGLPHRSAFRNKRYERVVIAYTFVSESLWFPAKCIMFGILQKRWRKSLCWGRDPKMSKMTVVRHLPKKAVEGRIGTPPQICFSQQSWMGGTIYILWNWRPWFQTWKCRIWCFPERFWSYFVWIFLYYAPFPRSGNVCSVWFYVGSNYFSDVIGGHRDAFEY